MRVRAMKVSDEFREFVKQTKDRLNADLERVTKIKFKQTRKPITEPLVTKLIVKKLKGVTINEGYEINLKRYRLKI